MSEFVPVYRRGRLETHAWVDDDDLERVAPYRWIWAGYAIAGARLSSDLPALKGIPMHRFILNLGPFEGVVHHVNEDTLDNRRANLQVVPDLLAHGSLPHPRRNLACSGRRHQLPPHERLIALSGAHNEEAAA